MKKILFVSAVALLAMGCCCKGEKKECCKDGEKKECCKDGEKKCCKEGEKECCKDASKECCKAAQEAQEEVVIAEEAVAEAE